MFIKKRKEISGLHLRVIVEKCKNYVNVILSPAYERISIPLGGGFDDGS